MHETLKQVQGDRLFQQPGRRRKAGILFLPVFFALWAPASWAEEKLKVEKMVVSSALIEEPVFETTSPVVVLTRNDVESTNALLMPDVLKPVPELNIIQFGGKGKHSGVSLRGTSSKNTLVLIDGVKANDPATGEFEFAGFPTDDIERIEIVKGPQSAVYGPGAQAGVINVITKKGAGGRLGVDAGVEYGSYNTLKPSLSVSGLWGWFDYRLTASYLETDGISAAKSGEEKDGYENKSFSGKLGFKAAKNADVELTGRYSSDRNELDGFDSVTGLPADDPDFIRSGERYMVSAKGKASLKKDWEQLLTLSTMRDTIESKDADNPADNGEVETGRDAFDWRHNFYSGDNVLTVGAEYSIDKGKSAGAFDKEVENKAVYLNTKNVNEALTLNAGVRYDDHETAGGRTTWRIGAVEYRRDSGLTFRASYGTGFRAPTVEELFSAGLSGLELKTEENTSWEVGMEKAAGRTVLAVTYFDQNYKNLIDGTFSAGKADIDGVETALSYALSENLGLKGAYTYLDAEDEDTGKRLPQRPENKFNAEASFNGEKLGLLADYVYVGERPGTGEAELDPYSVVNLSGTLRLTKRFYLTGRAENILDEDYEEAKGYRTPGRSYYWGLKAAF